MTTVAMTTLEDLLMAWELTLDQINEAEEEGRDITQLQEEHRSLSQRIGKRLHTIGHDVAYHTGPWVAITTIVVVPVDPPGEQSYGWSRRLVRMASEEIM